MSPSRKPPEPARSPASDQDVFDEMGNESFPASDPPAWSGTHIGAPRVDDGRKPAPRRRSRASGRRPPARS